MAALCWQASECGVLPLSCEAIGSVSRVKIRETITSSFCARRAELPPRLQRPPRQLARKMDQETLGSVVLLAIVTLISVVQNGEPEISIGGRAEKKKKNSVMCAELVPGQITSCCKCVRAQAPLWL